ncbi:MAG: hypothetical protein FJ217_14440, partial [Ignavibacteria bacterium]|nr:hypothetical protein [Ignavibacteria bacterium]
MLRRLGMMFMLVLALLVIGSSVAQTQTSVVLFILNAKVDVGGKVYLFWTRLPVDSVQYYAVYRAPMSNAMTFTRIDSTTKNEYVDTPPLTSVLTTYVYYVEAKMKGGTILRSNMALVALWPIPRTDVVRITSVPVRTGAVGVVYTYQVNAVSSDSTATLKYALALKPEGMTIGASTGLIEWRQPRRGIYRIIVAVVSSKGGKASQEYTLVISGATGTIAGTVTDTAAKPLGRIV